MTVTNLNKAISVVVTVTVPTTVESLIRGRNCDSYHHGGRFITVTVTALYKSISVVGTVTVTTLYKASGGNSDSYYPVLSPWWEQ